MCCGTLVVQETCVSSFLQQLVIGAVIIAAVLVDLMLKEKRG